MNKGPSLKKVALVTFGIEILGIAIAVGRAIILQRSPMRYFGEGGFMTWVSIIQLLVIASLCWKISSLRKAKTKTSRFFSKRKPEIFWRVTGFGMFFFALDEGLKIHENLDRFILNYFQIEITDLTSRLDDFIILAYAIAGLLIIYWFRNEIANYRDSLFWFVWALFFSFSTIFLDMLGHNRETFAIFADNLDQLNDIHHWFSAMEEIPKIFAGGAFIVTIYKCFQIAQKIKQQQVNFDQYSLKNRFENY